MPEADTPRVTQESVGPGSPSPPMARKWIHSGMQVTAILRPDWLPCKAISRPQPKHWELGVMRRKEPSTGYPPGLRSLDSSWPNCLSLLSCNEKDLLQRLKEEVVRAVAKIKGTEELSVNELVIDETQARIRGVSKEIDDLAESIRMHGLLEPIVVCTDPKGGYHVLMGQRRLLAHQKLGRTKILAAIIDEPVDQITAKVLSLTENLIRQDLDTKDVIDACTALYKKYGNAKAVAEATGLPYPKVLRHVKYDRLVPSMRALVDAGEVNIDMALRAQDASAANGNLIQAEAVELARQLAPLTGAQQRQILKMKQTHPERSARDLLEHTPAWRPIEAAHRHTQCRRASQASVVCQSPRHHSGPSGSQIHFRRPGKNTVYTHPRGWSAISRRR